MTSVLPVLGAPPQDMARTSAIRAFDDDRILVIGAFVVLGYLASALDRRRDGSITQGDNQTGIKLVLWAVMIAALLEAADGATAVLGFVLGGFKGGWAGIRDGLAFLLIAGGVVAAIWALLLPRTNNTERPQIERYALGAIGVILALRALSAGEAFLQRIFEKAAWGEISLGLAGLGVYGGLAILAITRLGAMSGWKVVPRAPQMPMQPPMGGYPPGSYPPPGGTGYPPAGGGYPPQGGGYPPQGGGGWPQS